MIDYEKVIQLVPTINHTIARNNRNEPAIRKWCRQYTLITEDEQEQWKKKIHEDPAIKMFRITTSLIGQAGVCGFTSIDRHNRNAEFSLYINIEKQRKGFGKKALYTLLRHGFEDWGFHKIWGEVFEGNPAMEMFTKIGFTPSGTLRDSYFREGKFINSTIIELLASEFKYEWNG